MALLINKVGADEETSLPTTLTVLTSSQAEPGSSNITQEDEQLNANSRKRMRLASGISGFFDRPLTYKEIEKANLTWLRCATAYFGCHLIY